MKSLSLILLSAIGFSATTNAGEFFIVRGHSYGYMSDRNTLIEEAKKDAIANIPFSNEKQRSQWMISGGSCTPQAMHPKCPFK